MKKIMAGILAIYSLQFPLQTTACTDFRLTAQDGSITIARSMEFGAEMNANVRTSNRGRTFQTSVGNQKLGLGWKGQYGYVFLDGFQQDMAVDGMNEQGLSIEGLYLPGETEYPTVTAGQESKALPYYNFGDWVLSQYKSVDEVKNALPNITVTSALLPAMGDQVFPLHFAIYDASGKGIIVEFTKGAVQVYDNDVGILTNSPTYDWQITNLRNYVNLSPVTQNPVKYGNLVFASTGQGSGMKGLPGDMSPPSRFVKTALMKSSVLPAKTAADALNLAEHIINNVDIPAGFVRTEQDGKQEFDTTQWVVFKDLTNKLFYYRTYGNLTLHAIDFKKLDFSEKSPRLKMPIADATSIISETEQFLTHKGNE